MRWLCAIWWVFVCDKYNIIPNIYILHFFRNIFLCTYVFKPCFSHFKQGYYKSNILHKQFNLFLILNLINLLYFLLFDINKIDSLYYLSVRFLMLTLFSSAVFISSDFFENKFLPFLNKFILLLVTLGFLLSQFH